jgi:hypothetical protein
MSNSLGIVNYEQFRGFEKEKRKIALSEELETQSINELSQVWGCKPSNLYDARRFLCIPKKNGEMSGTPRKSKKGIDEVSDTVKGYVDGRRTQLESQQQYVTPTGSTQPSYTYNVTTGMMPPPLIPVMPVEPENIFAIRLSGGMKGEEITDRLMRLAEIVSKDKKYKITFDIRELKDEEKA